ncbi:hypothetical protein G4B88_012025 [Cannabis sativa]|uniref:Uncharacterized protein n=1 Tax=Cannabis sativa TaxID=3483 RepID=A0A7J6HF76_CANSA|nr:hypothetical protein G4B88_012025 [Cannabis sativa]
MQNLKSCELERALWLKNSILIQPSLWSELICIITPQTLHPSHCIRVDSKSFSDCRMEILHSFHYFFTQSLSKISKVCDLFSICQFPQFIHNLILNRRMFAKQVYEPRKCGCCCVFPSYDNAKNYIPQRKRVIALASSKAMLNFLPSSLDPHMLSNSTPNATWNIESRTYANQVNLPEYQLSVPATGAYFFFALFFHRNCTVRRVKTKAKAENRTEFERISMDELKKIGDPVPMSLANLNRKKRRRAMDNIFICRYAKSLPRQIRRPPCKPFQKMNKQNL